MSLFSISMIQRFTLLWLDGLMKDAFLDTCFSVSINELGVGDLKTSVNSVSVRFKDLHLIFENSFNAYCLAPLMFKELWTETLKIWLGY